MTNVDLNNLTEAQQEWVDFARSAYTDNNLKMTHKPDVAIHDAQPIDLLLGVVELVIHQESIGDFICGMLHANDAEELNLFKTEDFIAESNKITDKLLGINDGTVRGEIMGMVKELAGNENVVEMGFGFQQADGSFVEGHVDEHGNISEHVTNRPTRH